MKTNEFVPRRPDYNLSFRCRDKPSIKGKIGCAWTEEDGSISITLNPLVVINEQQNLQLKLFINDQKIENKTE